MDLYIYIYKYRCIDVSSGASGAIRCLSHYCPFWLCLSLFLRDPPVLMSWAFLGPSCGFFVMFLVYRFHAFRKQHESILAPSWGQLGPCWLHIGSQLGVKLLQVGSKLGPNGPKRRFLKNLVAFPKGVQYRIEFWIDFKYFF